MPSERRHIEQAEKNETLFDFLDGAPLPFTDWQATALFYSALHYIEAYLATLGPAGTHVESHWQRSSYVAREAFLRPLFPDYQELKDRSEDARYRLVALPVPFVRSLKEHQHQRIKETVRARLGR